MSFGNTKSPTLSDLRENRQRYKLPQRRNKLGPMEYYMPEEMREQFVKHCTNEMNRTVMEWYGLSFSTLHRFMRELGVQKDMTKIRHKQAQLAKRICEKNGYYDSLRGHAPSEQCREALRRMRAEGFHPLKRLKEMNPRKYRAYLRKKGRQRKELIATERRRYRLTLMQVSNLPTHIYADVHYTKTQQTRRTAARKRGYVVGSIDPELGERMMLYYDDRTVRWPIFERNCVNDGFEFRHISTRGKLMAMEIDQGRIV